MQTLSLKEFLVLYYYCMFAIFVLLILVNEKVHGKGTKLCSPNVIVILADDLGYGDLGKVPTFDFSSLGQALHYK